MKNAWGYDLPNGTYEAAYDAEDGNGLVLTLNASIQSTLEAEAEHKEVTDRATKKGDSLEVSYVGKADGETFDQGDLTVEVGGEGFGGRIFRRNGRA